MTSGIPLPPSMVRGISISSVVYIADPQELVWLKCYKERGKTEKVLNFVAKIQHCFHTLKKH